MNQDGHLTTQELDAFLTARMAGQGAPVPSGVSSAEVTLADELVTLAEATLPDLTFVADLEARLVHADSAPAHPSALASFCQNLVESIPTGRQTMLKRTVIGLAGAVALAALILFGLPLLSPQKNLPRLPSLAALSAYAQGNYSAGTTSTGIFPGTQFVLSTTLPSAPQQVMVWRQSERKPFTVEEVRRLATRFGLKGNIYTQQTPTHQTAYIVLDGSRQMTFSSSGVLYVDNSARDAWLPTGAPIGSNITRTPTFEQQAAIAQEFLQAHGLLDFAYRVEPAQNGLTGMVYFAQLAEGHLVQDAGIQVTVSPDGQVTMVSYRPLALELVGQYPIRSARDAWDALLSGQPGGKVQYTVRRDAGSMPGSSRLEFDAQGRVTRIQDNFSPKSTPATFWRPRFRPAQRADLYGWANVLLPADGNGPPLLEMDGMWVRLSPDDARHIGEKWTTDLHVWGQVRQDALGLVLDIAGWEVASQPLFQPFSGTLQLDAGRGPAVFHREDGKTFALSSPPDNLMDGLAVTVYGREADRVEDGYPVMDWTGMQSPPDAGLSGAITTTVVSVTPMEQITVTATLAPEPTMPPQPTVTGQPASPRPVTHTVQPGETLLGIASRYGVTAEAILHANGLAQGDGIRVWQSLVIPASSNDLGLTAPAPAPTKAPPPSGWRSGGQVVGSVSSGAVSGPVLAPPKPPLQPGQRVESLMGVLYGGIREGNDGSRRLDVRLLLPSCKESALTCGWSAVLIGAGMAGIEQYSRLHVRVWGRYAIEGDQPMVEVERYEKAFPDEHIQAWLGHFEITTLEGRKVLIFKSRERNLYVWDESLAEMPEGIPEDKRAEYWADLASEQQYLVEGVVEPKTFGGYPIFRRLSSKTDKMIRQMTDLKDYQPRTGPEVVPPPPSLLPGKAFVEQVELVYYAAQIIDIPYPGGKAVRDPSVYIVQPVWRFAGHTEDGATFEVLVQAVRDEYLK